MTADTPAVLYVSIDRSGLSPVPVASFHKHTGAEEWVPKVANWQPIETAPRDGTWILAKLGDGVPDRWEHWRGRCFVIKHMGYTETGAYDLGWTLFPGMGVDDEWLAGWMPMPLAALPAAHEVTPESGKGE